MLPAWTSHLPCFKIWLLCNLGALQRHLFCSIGTSKIGLNLLEHTVGSMVLKNAASCDSSVIVAGGPQPLQDISHEAEAMHSSYPPEQSLPKQTRLASLALLDDVDITAAAHSIAMHVLKLLRDPMYAPPLVHALRDLFMLVYCNTCTRIEYDDLAGVCSSCGWKWLAVCL